MSSYSAAIKVMIEVPRDEGFDLAEVEYSTIVECADASIACTMVVGMIAQRFKQDEDAMHITHIDIMPAEERS